MALDNPSYWSDDPKLGEHVYKIKYHFNGVVKKCGNIFEEQIRDYFMYLVRHIKTRRMVDVRYSSADFDKIVFF